MNIKTDDQAPVAKCVGDDMMLSRRPKASMQNLLDAVAEFEPDLVLERVQPHPHGGPSRRVGRETIRQELKHP